MTWKKVGNIKGRPGENARPIKLFRRGKGIYWGYEGSITENLLFSIDELKGDSGADGTSIEEIYINDEGELILEKSDERIINLGNIKGKDGEIIHTYHHTHSGGGGTDPHRLVPTGGAAGEALVKYSDTNNDFGWGAVSAGTVTEVSVKTDNGFAGTVTNPSTTPEIALETTAEGMLYGEAGELKGRQYTEGYIPFGKSDGTLQEYSGFNFSPNLGGLYIKGTDVVSSRVICISDIPEDISAFSLTSDGLSSTVSFGINNSGMAFPNYGFLWSYTNYPIRFGMNSVSDVWQMRSTGLIMYRSLQEKKGADVASTGNLNLSNDGNTFDITGTTQINTIDVTNWQAGSRVILQFDGSLTVKHLGTGTGAQIYLTGAADFTTAPGDLLELYYDGTYWREITGSNTFGTGVTSLSGTSNRIDVSASTGAVTVNIASTYVGQNTITTLGTISTGEWKGTTLGVAYGGTGQTSYTDGQLLIGNSTGNTLTKATLTAGSGISVTNGSGSITIALSGAGIVTSVSGTTNQIDSTGGATPVLSLANGISLGSYQATTPPTGGALIPGEVAIGTSSIASATKVQINNTGGRSLYVTGSQLTSDLSSNQKAVFVDNAFAPTNGTGIAAAYDATSIWQAPFSKTITSGVCYRASPQLSVNIGTVSTMYGFWYDGGSASAGTVTTNYGGYFATPLGGTTKIPLYADSLSIGSDYATTVAPSKGLLVKGDVYVNTTSAINSGNFSIGGSIGASGVARVSDGNAAACSYAFTSSAGTGMFYSTTNTIGFATNGTSRVTIDSTLVATASTSTIRTGAGSVTTPSFAFTSQTNTGISQLYSSQIDFVIAGAHKMSVLATAFVPYGGNLIDLGTTGLYWKDNYSNRILTGTGTAGSPAYTFNGDTDNGLYYVTTNSIGLSTAGTGRLLIDGSGYVTMPSTAAFCAQLTSTASNVTGDGTFYTITGWTEAFDQGSNFNATTGVFTAPVTGRYQLNGVVRVNEIINTMSYYVLSIATSNRSYDAVLGPATTSFATLTVSATADMDAGDTAYLFVIVAGMTKVVDVNAGSYCTFSGFLAC